MHRCFIVLYKKCPALHRSTGYKARQRNYSSLILFHLHCKVCTVSIQTCTVSTQPIVLYLAGIFATQLRSSTHHGGGDPSPVVVAAQRLYFHIHSTQHRGEVPTVNLCHTPAAHCAGVIVKWWSIFIWQINWLHVGIEQCRFAELLPKTKWWSVTSA